MLFILDRRFETIGVITNKSPKGLSYSEDLYTQTIENNVSTFEFQVDAKHPNASLLEVGCFILYTDMDNKNQLFEIMEVSDRHSDSMTKSLYCEHSAVSDLIGNIVRPFTGSSWALKTTATHILNGSSWTLGTVPFNEIKDVKFESHVTSLEALHIITKLYGVEMEYEVEFNGTSVTRKIINLVEKRGQKTGQVFEYKMDLIEVEKVIDSKNLVTALIAVGKDGITLNGFNGADNSGRYILENDYVYDKDAFQRFNKKGKHIFGVFESDTPNNITLYNETIEKLKELSTPKSTYTCKVITLEKMSGYSHKKVRIGDTIYVKDFEYQPPLLLEARVVELKRSKTNPDGDEVTLGDYIPIDFAQSDKIKLLQNIIKKNQAELNEELEDVRENVIYKVELHSSNGLTFKNGQINSTLSAVVYKGKDEITDSLVNNAFIWRKFDKDGYLDSAWTYAHEGVGRQVIVTRDDIDKKATFSCDVVGSLLK